MGHGSCLVRLHTGERLRHLRLLGLLGKPLHLGLHGVPFIPEQPQLPQLLLRFLPGCQFCAGCLPLCQLLLCLFQNIPGLCHPCCIFLRSLVGQSLLMVIQLLQPSLDFFNALLHFFALGLQRFHLRQFFFQSIPLHFRLGQQAGAIIPAPVFQFLQLHRQPVGSAAFISGGDQCIEPPAQGFILGHRQICLADESGPAEHCLLHPQQHLTAVCRCQFIHRQTCCRFVSPEFSQRNPPLGGPFNGDIPALPVQVNPAGHGTSGPGGIVVLVGQGVFCGLGPGIHAVEHGNQKGAPGAFSPLIGCGDDIQSRLQGQALVFQLAEGSRHFIDSHKVTSRPFSSFLEISAAS